MGLHVHDRSSERRLWPLRTQQQWTRGPSEFQAYHVQDKYTISDFHTYCPSFPYIWVSKTRGAIFRESSHPWRHLSFRGGGGSRAGVFFFGPHFFMLIPPGSPAKAAFQLLFLFWFTVCGKSTYTREAGCRGPRMCTTGSTGRLVELLLLPLSAGNGPFAGVDVPPMPGGEKG